MLRLYHYPLSPCSEKVRFALALKGVAWEEVILDLAEKENLTGAYLSINSSGCIPTLVNNEDIVVESTAILDYIEALFPDPCLLPDVPMQRANMRLWAKWVDEVLHPAWPGIAWVVLVRPRWLQMGDKAVHEMVAKLPDPKRRERQLDLYSAGFSSSLSEHAFDVLTKTLHRMDRALEETPMLCGVSPSLADISILPYLTAARAFGILDEGFPVPATVARWMETLIGLDALSPVLKTQISPERSEEISAVGRKSLHTLMSRKSGFEQHVTQ